MAENILRTKGRGQGYKFDRGGTPAEFGPYIGVVKNNIDPTRSGRLQVYIEQFGGDNPADKSLWRTVSYIPPFYGTTAPPPGAQSGPGSFIANQQSYGMWFTPPDLGVSVICFFVAGDPNQGYYMGCVPDPGVNHMLPGIGASKKFSLSKQQQESGYFNDVTQLPVTEINVDNLAISENPRFFDQEKPTHSVVTAVMLQQGLIKDVIRGPITSNSQRESPSAVFGVSTPGRPIYQGGLTDKDIKSKLDSGQLKPQDVKIVSRRGGHSIVLDDGNLTGQDNLVRIRTSKGHQITMSDEGDCFYIVHANGQTWIELGSEGTVDVFSTNSVNIRTKGEINLHADKDINMYAGNNINIKSGNNIKAQAMGALELLSSAQLTVFSNGTIGILSDSELNLESTSGSWGGGSSLVFDANSIDLNGPSANGVDEPEEIADRELPDTVFESGSGWKVDEGALTTIVSRAPTHEPYPYHNKGVSTANSLDGITENTTEVVQQVNAQEPAGGGVSAVIGGGGGSVSESNSELNKTLVTLIKQPVTSPITAADVLIETTAKVSVGTLDIKQVTGLLSSKAAITNQSSTELSIANGVGKFGITPDQLEQQGLLKPGTVQSYLSDPSSIYTILSSPTVWTGKYNVVDLDSFLNNEKLQSVVQQKIMNDSLQSLQETGLVTGTETPTQLATVVQNASKYGTDSTAEWLVGKAPSNEIADLNSLAKNAQYAVNVVDQKLPTFVSLGGPVTGVSNTVDRTLVDTAANSIIDDPKVPTITYGQEERVDETITATSVTINTNFNGLANNWKTFLITIKQRLDQAEKVVNLLELQSSVNNTQLDLVRKEAQLIRLEYNTKNSALRSIVLTNANAGPTNLIASFIETYNTILELNALVEMYINSLITRITALGKT